MISVEILKYRTQLIKNVEFYKIKSQILRLQKDFYFSSLLKKSVLELGKQLFFLSMKCFLSGFTDLSINAFAENDYNKFIDEQHRDDNERKNPIIIAHTQIIIF